MSLTGLMWLASRCVLGFVGAAALPRSPALPTVSSVGGVACSPQWLPVLLAFGNLPMVPSSSPMPPPPPAPWSPDPSPPPPPPSPYTFTKKDALNTAVQAVNANPASAIVTYGPVADWDVSGVSDMSYLFNNLKNFNADISSWNTSGVTDMREMLAVRSSPCPALNLQSSSPLHGALDAR